MQARISLEPFPLSEITVDVWMALSVIPMLVALAIYMWLSWRFDRAQRRDARHYEEMVHSVHAPLQASMPGLLPRERAAKGDSQA